MQHYQLDIVFQFSISSDELPSLLLGYNSDEDGDDDDVTRDKNFSRCSKTKQK